MIWHAWVSVKRWFWTPLGWCLLLAPAQGLLVGAVALARPEAAAQGALAPFWLLVFALASVCASPILIQMGSSPSHSGAHPELPLGWRQRSVASVAGSLVPAIVAALGLRTALWLALRETAFGAGLVEDWLLAPEHTLELLLGMAVVVLAGVPGALAADASFISARPRLALAVPLAVLLLALALSKLGPGSGLGLGLLAAASSIAALPALLRDPRLLGRPTWSQGLSLGGPGLARAVLRTVAAALLLAASILVLPRLLGDPTAGEKGWELELVLALSLGFGVAPAFTPGGFPLAWTGRAQFPELREALSLLPVDPRRLGWRALAYGLGFALVPLVAALITGQWRSFSGLGFLSVLLPLTLAWSVGITLGTRHLYVGLGLAVGLIVATAVGLLVARLGLLLSAPGTETGPSWAWLAIPPVLALAWVLSPLLRGPARPS